MADCPDHDALAAFIVRKAEVDELLARLVALSDEHFGFTPDEIDWGHVGTIAAIAESLKRIDEAVPMRATTAL